MGTLEGTVFSGSASNPVRGAQVSTFGPTSTSTSTDAAGTFNLIVLPGSYAVSVTATGYATATLTNVSVTAGGVTTVPFDLGTSSSSSTSTSSSSSSGTATTTASSSSSSSSGTTGTSGPATLTGPLAFNVLTALEFPTMTDDGGANFSDVQVGLYDAAFTCQDFMTNRGLPFTVHHLVLMEAKDIAGIPLQGGAYGIPTSNLGLDQDLLFYRVFYPEAGYTEVDANTGTINYTAPVSNFGVSGSFTTVMSDASNLVGEFQATYCGP